MWWRMALAAADVGHIDIGLTFLGDPKNNTVGDRILPGNDDWYTCIWIRKVLEVRKYTTRAVMIDEFQTTVLWKVNLTKSLQPDGMSQSTRIPLFNARPPITSSNQHPETHSGGVATTCLTDLRPIWNKFSRKKSSSKTTSDQMICKHHNPMFTFGGHVQETLPEKNKTSLVQRRNSIPIETRGCE